MTGFKNTPALEILDHKINSYIVKNFNSMELLNSINWMSAKIKNKEYKRVGARNKIMEFDTKIIAQKYINLYENTLKMHIKE